MFDVLTHAHTHTHTLSLSLLDVSYPLRLLRLMRMLAVGVVMVAGEEVGGREEQERK